MSNPSHYEISAVHDRDIIEFLKSLDLLKEFKEGRIHCKFCETEISFQNLQCVYPKKNEIIFCCNKIKWCYLGKYEKLPEEYKSLIHKDTQTNIITTQDENNLKSSSIQQKSLITPFLPVSQVNTCQQCMSTRTG
jgi:hypothetical protein